MSALQAKQFDLPDEVRSFKDDTGMLQLVDLSGSVVGYGVFKAGWRWSEHVKPLTGTPSCEVEHIGYVLKGRMKVVMDSGEQIEIGPGDVFHLPPGHDAWTVGEEDCILLDFGGLRGYAQPGAGAVEGTA